MIYTFNECIRLYGSQYALRKAIKKREIYKIDKGLYSTCKKVRDLDVFIKEYPNSIFTMESALYYLGISDVIPTKYVIATDRDATKIKKTNIKQFFINESLMRIGVTKINHLGTDINVFDKERMLIETIRYKRKLPFDYYKEIINYYRNHINDVDIPLVLEYVEAFPRKEKIIRTIQMEVL